jgi:hypothetical protein
MIGGAAMNLRNLTEEEFLSLAEEEGKASINIVRRPHSSAFLIAAVKTVNTEILASPE